MTIKVFITRITLNMNKILIILITKKLSTKNLSKKNDNKNYNYYNSEINFKVNNADIDSKINLNKFYADEIKNVFSLKLL